MKYTVVRVRTLIEKLYFEVENENDDNTTILKKADALPGPTRRETVRDTQTVCSGILVERDKR